MSKLSRFLNQARALLEGAEEERSNPPDCGTPHTGPPLHRWDSRQKVLALGQGDFIELGEAFCGFSAMGSTGSGKSSALILLALALMLLHCGFVWHCAKPDEIQLVRRIAKRAGRENDVVVIGEEVDGSISDARFNPLEYEAGKGLGTGSLVKYLGDCHRVLSHRDGESSGGSSSSERFWSDQFERLLRHCIDTARLAGRRLSVGLLREIQLSAPLNNEQLASDAWAQKSTCWQCLIEAEKRADRGEIAQFDHERILNFWTRDYLNFDSKPRSTIDVMAASLADCFYAEEPLRSIVTTTTNVTPDDVINNGKIVVLSLPTSVYLEAGRMAQFCFKYSYQRAMLRRRKPIDDSPMRPTVLWCDEAHRFAHSFDATYFSEIRSNRGINVFIEQGIGGYMDALGVQSKEQVDRYLQNLATMLFFQSDSHLTNVFAADAIGKRMLTKETDSWHQHQDGATGGGSETTEERHQVLPGEFSRLRRGGAANNLIVEAIITAAGKTFNATGTNYMRCQFKQTELTK